MRNDQTLCTVLTSWGAPQWALTSDVDEQVIYHCRTVGELLSVEAGDVIAVEIVQCDELTIEAGAATIERHPVFLRVGDSRLSLTEAHELVQIVTSAIGLFECNAAIG